MGRSTIRKDGVPFTQVEKNRRSRAKKKAEEKAEFQAQQDAERRMRLTQANGDLGNLPRAITNITEVDLASGSVSAVISDPPYAQVELPLYGELARFARTICDMIVAWQMLCSYFRRLIRSATKRSSTRGAGARGRSRSLRASMI
jgi:hypothetical protein